MSKTVVTHLSPDLDAITSIWLLTYFLPGWDEAVLKFVPAGKTLEGKDPDENPEIIHVDTGLGKFDHHQVKDRNLSATRLVFNFLKNEKHIKGVEMQALSRIADFVTTIDNFGEIHFHNPASDIYDFSLYQLIDGLKTTSKSDVEICNITFDLLNGSYNHLKNKVRAEAEIEKGFVFESRWGKTIALETKNDQVLKLSLKMGYSCAIKKNPEGGHVRINTFPNDKLDLTPLYEAFQKADPKATWFLHSSKNLLINGSTKSPNAVPSSLTIQKVIEIIREIK